MTKKITKSYRVELRAFNRIDEVNCGGYIGTAMSRFGKKPGAILTEAIELYKTICEGLGNKIPEPWTAIVYNDYSTSKGLMKSDVQMVRTFSLSTHTVKTLKWLEWCSFDEEQGTDVPIAKIITRALWWFDAATYKPEGAGNGVWALHTADEMTEMLHDPSKRPKRQKKNHI